MHQAYHCTLHEKGLHLGTVSGGRACLGSPTGGWAARRERERRTEKHEGSAFCVKMRLAAYTSGSRRPGFRKLLVEVPGFWAFQSWTGSWI